MYENAHGLPVGQVNAHLGDELVMRVGIPHKGGTLAFHAFNQEWPVMVSANAFWSSKRAAFAFPETTNLSELDFAMDSAGFTSMLLWRNKGKQRGMAGIFPWTCSEYVDFANESNASWWSQPDLCVEKEIVSSAQEIDFRINATATFLEGTLMLLYEWQNELSRTCSSTVVANLLKPPAPVIQGWDSAHYERSLELMQQVWSRWQPWIAPPALIGLGSVCRRELNHPTHGLYAILDRLEPLIPTGSRFHCFGVKGEALTKIRDKHWVASADSMAWDFSARVKAHRSGISNTMAHRCSEMDQWMSAALKRIGTRYDQHLAQPLAA